MVPFDEECNKGKRMVFSPSTRGSFAWNGRRLINVSTTETESVFLSKLFDFWPL